MESLIFVIAISSIFVSIGIRIICYPQGFRQFLRYLNFLKGNRFNFSDKQKSTPTIRTSKGLIRTILTAYIIVLVVVGILATVITSIQSTHAAGPIVSLNWDNVDWVAGNLTQTFQGIGGPPGQADITVSFNVDPDCLGSLGGGNPPLPDDTTTITGGFPITESLLILVDYTRAGCTQQFTEVTVSFSHPGGVNNLTVPILDIDDNPTYVDQVSVSATDGTNTYLANHPQTSVVFTNTQVTYDGVSTFTSIGGAVNNNQPDGNVVVSFGQTGIQSLTIRYQNPNVPPNVQGISFGIFSFQASQQADLELGKTVSNSTPNVGDTINFTLTLLNRGPDPATGVTVSDNLPDGFNFVSATPSQGTYNSGTGIWDVGGLAANDTATLDIQVTVNGSPPATNYINRAQVASSDQLDPDSTPGNGTTNGEDDETSASIVPPGSPRADLAINKVSQPNPYVAGGPITYTIVVNNLGPDSVNAITVTDNLPAQVQGPTYTESSGTYNSGTGVWTGITLNANDSVTLTIVGTVQAGFNGVLQNTATVASPLPDPNPNNNLEPDTNSPTADLAINKVSQPNPYVAGGPITYTIVVNNLGPSTVNAITVTDNLPSQIQGPPTYTASSGTYNSGTGSWTGITLNANDSISLSIVGMVQAGFAGALQNTASVASPLPDPDPTNNTEGDVNGTNPGGSPAGGDSSGDSDDDDDDDVLPPPAGTEVGASPTPVPTPAPLPVLLLPETGLRESEPDIGMIGVILVMLVIVGAGSVFYIVRKN